MAKSATAVKAVSATIEAPVTTGEKAAKTLNEAQKQAYDALPTTSAKIRYLNGLNWSRGEIAKYTGKRYQHVRNVLITPLVPKAA